MHADEPSHITLKQPVTYTRRCIEIAELAVLRKLERVVLKRQMQRPLAVQCHGRLQVQVGRSQTDYVGTQRIGLCRYSQAAGKEACQKKCLLSYRLLLLFLDDNHFPGSQGIEPTVLPLAGGTIEFHMHSLADLDGIPVNVGVHQLKHRLCGLFSSVSRTNSRLFHSLPDVLPIPSLMGRTAMIFPCISIFINIGLM